MLDPVHLACLLCMIAVPLTLDEGKRQLTVNVPLRPQTDYALALNKRLKESGEPFENVLYYLVTCRQEDKGKTADS